MQSSLRHSGSRWLGVREEPTRAGEVHRRIMGGEHQPMSKSSTRSGGFDNPAEERLSAIRSVVERTLIRVQKGFAQDSFKLPRPSLNTVASCLTGFAEDLHCGVGLWECLERYHADFFGTPLPFMHVGEGELPPGAMATDRVHYFLWVLYGQLNPERIMPPDHPDLLSLADAAANVLRVRFVKVPRESDRKAFLETPNELGWEVKRKLIRLGTESYLLRIPFERYMEEEREPGSEIDVIDDFLCQRCTEWAGLGALELLAGTLNLPEDRRTELLSWSERHNAVFKVLSGTKELLVLLNLINDREYRVRMDLDRNPFPLGSFVHGSLVPWADEWYWSGSQRVFKGLDKSTIEQLKRDYRLKPDLFYRYSPEELIRAQALVRRQHEEFVTRYGTDWVAYPDGLTMAADWQRAAREKIEAMPSAERQRFMKKHGLKAASPEMQLPRELLDQESGIAVYFNPEEGQEIIEDFDRLRSALEKRGTGLTSDEAEAIRGWILSESISPGFVRRLAGEFGSESIEAAFALDGQRQDYALDYLLRRFKGRYFRPRYPTLTIAD